MGRLGGRPCGWLGGRWGRGRQTGLIRGPWNEREGSVEAQLSHRLLCAAHPPRVTPVPRRACGAGQESARGRPEPSQKGPGSVNRGGWVRDGLLRRVAAAHYWVAEAPLCLTAAIDNSVPSCGGGPFNTSTRSFAPRRVPLANTQKCGRHQNAEAKLGGGVGCASEGFQGKASGFEGQRGRERRSNPVRSI